MRNGEFFIRFKFSKRSAQRDIEEVGVVAEASGAARDIEDFALRGSLGEAQNAAGSRQRNDADIMCSAAPGLIAGYWC